MKSYLFATVFAMLAVACSQKDKKDSIGGGRKEEVYFDVTVDGQKKQLENIHYAREGTTVHLAAWSEDFPNLNVTLTATNDDDFRGSYSYDFTMAAGTCIVLYGVGESDGYETHYWDCPGESLLLVTSPGKVVIDLIERINGDEFISGTFSSEVYQPVGNCPYAVVKKKVIEAKFRLKKAR